jgi:hypothetical protein
MTPLPHGSLTAACLTLAAGLACQAQPAAPPVVPDGVTQLARVESNAINEASGIAASHRYPEHFWIHNDSGDQPRLFLVDHHGRTRLELRLTGARHVDWEDMAVAPLDDDHTRVVVGDIGDNAERRDSITLYWFQENELPAELDAATTQAAVKPRVTTLTYPDGPHDAEALFIDPTTRHGFIIAKTAGEDLAGVYRWPLSTEDDATLRLARVAELPRLHPLPFGQLATAADLSPDARRLIVRTYLGAWQFTAAAAPTADDPAPWFSATPQPIPAATEAQGEAVCYDRTAERIITISERLPTHLHATDLSLTPADGLE